MIKLLRIFFYGFLIRPFLLFVLGFNIRNVDRLKIKGAHLIAANHNSHLDAMVLMSLFPLKDLDKVKVVAAKDYFCRNRIMTWFSINIIGIIPIDRAGKSKDPLNPVFDSLNNNVTVIIFPEGSRGDPEKRQSLKYGIAKILEHKNHVKITPIYMDGLGKSLPKGESLLVPFVCKISIGEDIFWQRDKAQVINDLEHAYDRLAEDMQVQSWE